MSVFGLKDLGTKIAITALGFSLIPLIVLVPFFWNYVWVGIMAAR